ncbi:hypothetical protein [uncultured Aquimonas sp.]|uniref:hypothetical protein n=1 Tax=uncultured Aquimonas sp. TaxID=385483 RepID=UPI00086B23F7|nr:hypothetical protein [uncultured Aquimonas sp.]ODU46605.1 MAG: hypothetical protein ABS96_08770 [Xanthomonadaceae bacterium SCN 69-123]
MNTVAPEEIRNIAGQVRAYVATLHARRGELRAERSQLEEERDALLNAPVNREDAIRFVFDYIDRRAARFTEICGWKVQLSRVLKPGNASGAVGQQYGPGVLTLAEINDSLSMDAVRNEHRFGEGGICFLSAGRDTRSFVRTFDDMALYFFGDLIKEKLRPYVEAHMPELAGADAARVGPPVEERRVRLTEISVRLEEIGTEDAALSKELQELSAPNPTDALRAAGCREPMRDLSHVPPEAINKYQQRMNAQNLSAVAQEYGVTPADLSEAFNAREKATLERRFLASGPVKL